MQSSLSPASEDTPLLAASPPTQLLHSSWVFPERSLFHTESHSYEPDESEVW